MQRFEIYNAEMIWNGCRDVRPWLIIEVRSGEILGCFPIASECYGGNCFPIESTHTDFPATGLTKSCFVHDSHIIEIPASNFRRFRGRLEGQLLADFIDYSGIA